MKNKSAIKKDLKLAGVWVGTPFWIACLKFWSVVVQSLEKGPQAEPPKGNEAGGENDAVERQFKPRARRATQVLPLAAQPVVEVGAIVCSLLGECETLSVLLELAGGALNFELGFASGLWHPHLVCFGKIGTNYRHVAQPQPAATMKKYATTTNNMRKGRGGVTWPGWLELLPRCSPSPLEYLDGLQKEARRYLSARAGRQRACFFHNWQYQRRCHFI